MKKFAFPLDRALDWRRLQLQLEEASMERMNIQFRHLLEQAQLLDVQAHQQRSQILENRQALGIELSTMDHYRKSLHAQKMQLDHQAILLKNQLAEKAETVKARRRDVRLLEKLKQQRLQEWTQESSREVESLAEESYLVRWKQNKT